MIVKQLSCVIYMQSVRCQELMQKNGCSCTSVVSTCTSVVSSHAIKLSQVVTVPSLSMKRLRKHPENDSGPESDDMNASDSQEPEQSS